MSHVTAEESSVARAAMPWKARGRAAAQRIGVDPRYLRRLRWVHKAHAVRHSGASVSRNLGLVLAAPEPDNFTYEISNQAALADWVAVSSGATVADAAALVEEPQRDHVLMRQLTAATAGRWLWTKRSPPFGRRLGWYALVRATRPELIVEVGSHDGLGSLMMLRALERNADEGHPGRLVSFDVNPTAGWLVGSHPFWELRIQASGDGLAEVTAGHTVGVFLYDGWHTYDSERADLELVVDHLAPDGLLISDDAAVTGALRELADGRGLHYIEFHEHPIRHFHPGVTMACARAGDG